jgi:hypothetical protein
MLLLLLRNATAATAAWEASISSVAAVDWNFSVERRSSLGGNPSPCYLL